jgi:SAM-dependent methyltransferase
VTGPGTAVAPARPGPALEDLALVTVDGVEIDIAVDRWWAAPDATEHALLATLPDPVLDVGCGPGRIVAALASAGRVALGVDPSPLAVHAAARRRAPVLRRSVFGPLPGEGRWGSVVLLDGNIGIGGDPAALLRRCAALARRRGQVLAEVAAPGSPTGALTVRLESADATTPWFPWATVAADALPDLARAAGLRAAGLDMSGGRWFARLERP